MSLKHRADIDSLFKQGQRFPTDFFTLIWQPADQFKYGVFVSKRLGCACTRNRAKRRLREAVRLSRSCLQAVGRVAILPRPDRPEPKLEQLIEDVSRIFQKISYQA
ncbi:MAG: ribonuclease P protein component [candidate division Zixibacteria bacterium]|nr:ribonuclease P protein component [candidate division Zixibacteria bacterium]